MQFKKIMVTGSSGTIGTRLCEKLLESGIDFIGVDWKENKWNKEVEAKTIHVDLRDQNAVLSISVDCDVIIHLAANARVYDLVVDPNMAMDNIKTIFNILEFARVKNIKKVLFSSSREVYGNSEKIIHTEGDVRLDLCESPYAASKLSGEAFLWAYRSCYDIDFIIMRFSNVYGCYDESNRFVPLIINLCKQNKDIVIFGEDKLLDFTYIDDTVAGVLSLVNNFEKVKNNIYNIASGEGQKLVDVANIIKKIMSSNSEIKISVNRTGEVVKYVADITLANKSIQYKPGVYIEEGVSRAVEWYLKNI